MPPGHRHRPRGPSAHLPAAIPGAGAVVTHEHRITATSARCPKPRTSAVETRFWHSPLWCWAAPVPSARVWPIACKRLSGTDMAGVIEDFGSAVARVEEAGERVTITV